MSFKGGPGGDIGESEVTTQGSGSFGVVQVAEQVNPAAPADGAGGILYSKADGKPYWVSNELSETDLSAGGGISHDGSTANGILTFKDADEATVESKALVDGAKITIGNGTAEDTLLVFDGNAADFRIGIDDDSDTLEIGAGAAHDTTAAVVVDASGHVVKIGQDSPSSGQFLKWDGSKAVWDAAGGGSDTVTFIERAYSYMGFPHRKYVHYYPGASTTFESSREWSYYNASFGHSQDTSIAVTPEHALAYWSSFIVPVACTINSAKIWYKSDQNQNTYFGIYSGDLSSADNSSNDITFTEMKRATSAGNTSGRMHAVSLTGLSNNSLAAGDMIAVALDGNQTSNGSWNAQNVFFQIVIQATPS